MNSIYEEIRVTIHSVWRLRWLALAVAAVVCVLGWTAIALIPNSYESAARIQIQTQNILQSSTGVGPSDHQRDIEQVQQTLVSTVNLEKVVRGTDLGVRATSPSDVAAMVDTLRKNISIKSTQDNLFEISARSSAGGLSDAENAKVARDVVQKLVDIFVEENIAGSRSETTQTIRFLDGELAKREGALREAEQRKAEFEQRYAGLLPGVGSIAERMEGARAELGQVESNLAAAQASLAAVNGQMASIPATVAVPNYGGGGSSGPSAVQTLQAQIAEAQSRGWTDQHPDIIAMRNQLSRLRAIAPRGGGGGGGGGGSTANPMYISLRSMQAEKQATVAALQARRAQLSSDMAQFTTRMADEPGVSAEQQRLNRDYDVLKDQYDKLLADRESARLRNDVSTQTDAVRFQVVDPPSAPRVPVAPNRPLLLAAVLILGGGAGLGIAFAKAQLQPTYVTADRMAHATGMPVLGAISEVLTAPVRADRRRKLVWFGSATGALAATFALMLVVEFVQRGMVG